MTTSLFFFVWRPVQLHWLHCPKVASVVMWLPVPLTQQTVRPCWSACTRCKAMTTFRIFEWKLLYDLVTTVTREAKNVMSWDTTKVKKSNGCLMGVLFLFQKCFEGDLREGFKKKEKNGKTSIKGPRFTLLKFGILIPKNIQKYWVLNILEYWFQIPIEEPNCPIYQTPCIPERNITHVWCKSYSMSIQILISHSILVVL